MNGFLSRAQEILDIAAKGEDGADAAILIDRQGGIRMVEAAGWSLAGLMAEFGAAEIYRIRRNGAGVRIDGWESGQRCTLERFSPTGMPRALPGNPAIPHAVMQQVLLAGAA